MRRRRKELLRKKKAPLKTLQALIKMGMGRRSLLASLAGAGQPPATVDKHAEEEEEAEALLGLQLTKGQQTLHAYKHAEEEEEEAETLDPVAQAALFGAWQGLLGTAVHLVHSLQAAQWDESLFISCSSSSSEGNHSDAGSSEARVLWPQLDTAGAAAAAASLETPGSNAAVAAMQRQLSKLGATLSSALMPQAADIGVTDSSSISNAHSATDAEAAAAAALAAIEALAKQTSAAGNDTDALMRLLAGQGICLPDFAEDPGTSASGTAARPSGTGCVRLGSTGEAASSQQQQQQQQRSPRRSSITGNSSNPAATAAGAPAHPNSSPRVNLELAKRVSAVAAGTGSDNGSSSAGSSSAGGLGFVACNVGPSCDGGTAEGWSLSGNQPDAAGLAAAANVRAQAALRRVSDGVEQHATEEAGVVSPAGRRTSTNGNRTRRPSITGTLAAAIGASAGGMHSPEARSGSASLRASEAAVTGLIEGQALFVAAQRAPLATEALQHMAALQAVLAEAAKVIRSWQQQRIIIALLQQRLKAAAVHMQLGQQRLAAALQELKEINDAQLHSSSSAAAASAEYQALLLQFQQVQQQLEQAQAAKGQLSQDSTQLQASLEAALAAAAAANDKQQLLEQQLQVLQQQLEQDQAAKAAQQQQLDEALAELERLRSEHANLQAEAGSGAAASAAQLSQLQASHQELQTQHEKLQGAFSAAEAAAAASAGQQQQLTQQLQQTQQQLQQLQAAFAALQEQHLQQGQQLGESQQALSQLQEKHQLQEQELAGKQQRLQEMQALQEDAQQRQQRLESEHQQLLERMSGEQQHALQQQKQLQDENEQKTVALQQLEAEKQKLEQQRQQLAESGQQQQEQLSSTQQQLQQLQAEMQQAQQQQQQLAGEKEALLEQQLQLLNKHEQAAARAKAAQQEVADMQAAAKAAEEKRLAMPRRSTQVTSTDHIEQGWVRTRGVQTGEELDPRNKKDVGTPADPALISYFFRDIKQKQRGGGGALIGYDPQAAQAAAATAVGPGSAKSWTGAALPPISQSGATEQSAAKRRPATMPGSLSPARQGALPTVAAKKPPAPEEETGGFDTRPAPFEVKQRVDRRRDRTMRLEAEPGEAGADGDRCVVMQAFIGCLARFGVNVFVDRRRDRTMRLEAEPGEAAADGDRDRTMRLETEPGEAGADGDRWDYSHDERDNEIAELKRRLVEEGRKAKEAAAKAETDLRDVLTSLQASKHSVEQLQAENFTLRKEIDSLRIGLQANLDAGSALDAASGNGSSTGGVSAAAAAALLSASGAAGALRPSVFAGGVSASKALGGRTSATGFVGGGSSPGGSFWGSGFGGSVSAGGAARPSVALLSLSGGAAAGVGLPAAVGGSSSNSSSSNGGLLSAVGARRSSAGRASVLAAQSPYASQGLKAAAAQKTAHKSQVGLQSRAADVDTAAGRAQQ
uniref:Uncharacterized protein n=1 Tax=Tetradesmus obliquus TaxID=3088 RepID=A0A383VSA4_TETOB|eukprot:jgi/Sobl393_1/16388/SZX67770.1